MISLMLALALALTSQSMAVARGASAATGQMVLCTGSGPVAIYTDAQGKPTSAPHICPDAALNVLVDVATMGAKTPWEVARLDTFPRLLQKAAPQLPRLSPQSRAPPLTV